MATTTAAKKPAAKKPAAPRAPKSAAKTAPVAVQGVATGKLVQIIGAVVDVGRATCPRSSTRRDHNVDQRTGQPSAWCSKWLSTWASTRAIAMDTTEG
jgi:F-type H+-transporting ATPase subunit beta